MADPASDLVCAWIDAYYSRRDEDMIPLADPEIEIRPRAGHGARLYRGIGGLRRWLRYTGPARSEIDSYSTAVLDDGRILAEATLDGIDVTALFEVRDGRIACVTMYISDSRMLEQIGKITTQPRERSRHRVSGAQMSESVEAAGPSSGA